MKRTVRNCVVLALVTLALSGLSLAQSLTNRVAANIPFNFYAGERNYPAGNYEFALNDQNQTVTVTNTANGRSMLLLALPGESLGYGNQARQGFNHPELQFNSIGGEYVLVGLETNVAGVNFPKQKKVVMGANQQGELVTIAAVQR